MKDEITPNGADMKLLTHLNFPGNCAQAFHYYEAESWGNNTTLMRQSQAPGANSKPGQEDPVLHARMEIGETILIGNDVPWIVSSPCAAHISTLVWIPQKKLSGFMVCS